MPIPARPICRGSTRVNLIIADQQGACFMTNRPEAARITLASGLYGLSNGKLDEPWPKTMRLKSVLLDWITGDAAQPDTLFDGLREEILPDIGRDPSAPSDVPQEPNHSPIFIRNPIYGTRCSTVVAIDMAGQGVIIERRFSPQGADIGETRLSFSWAG
jgi:uncharacterized protein with NRDE domain